jgi:hypothetical protein
VGSDDALVEQDYRAALQSLSTGEPVEETRIVTCQSCAAAFSAQAEVESESCPYCGGPFVAAPATHRQLRPKALVSFAVPEADARTRLKAWLGSLWFAPGDVQKLARAEGRLAGIYVPYWTYDADTETAYVGERGTAYQVPEQVTATDGQGRLVTQTVYRTQIRWAPVRGQVARRFDDVLVLASRSLPEAVVNRLGSWRLEDLRPWQAEFLSGFRSETYQVDLEAGFETAQRMMAPVIQRDILSDIGGDAQRIHRQQTRFGEVHFKHILLPIWSAAYRYGGKTYRFVVNGQTGEVQGERPYSKIKIALAVVLGLVVLGGAVFLFSRYQDPMPPQLSPYLQPSSPYPPAGFPADPYRRY